MASIKTEFVESQSVGFRQIRLTFEGGKSETYFQEYKATDGWHRLSDGVKASIQLDAFICKAVEGHQKRRADRIAALEAQMHG